MSDEYPPKSELPLSKERAMEEAERMESLIQGDFARGYDHASQLVDNQFTYERSGEDDPNSEGFLLRERLRSRTAEEIESFDINADGLAIHGTRLSQVEGVLRGGLGYKGKDDTINPSGGIWYNLVGHPAQSIDGDVKGKIGFGPDRLRFGNRVVFITDIFKQLWPNEVNANLQFANEGDNGVFGEICVSLNEDDDDELKMGIEYFHTHPIDWRTYKSVPISNRILIPEFKPELEEDYNRDGTVKMFAWQGLTSNSVETNRRAYRQLLSPNALNAIVVSREGNGGYTDEERHKPVQEIVDEIIAIQDRLYPKNEQIPIYDEDGKCLYNPLKT